jgi:hypothetical protein
MLKTLALSVLVSMPALAADFVELAQKANAEPPATHDAKDALWIALFKLPQWHFLMTPKSVVNKQASVQVIAGEAWVLVFTDSEKLKAYAKANKNLAADGSALFLSMKPEDARKYIEGQGPEVTGARFNEGQKQGWFAPKRVVGVIHAYLKKNGKL